MDSKNSSRRAVIGIVLAAMGWLLSLAAGFWACEQRGLDALDELFRRDAERLAEPKGKHHEQRTHHHWGTTRSELPFGGQRIVVDRPRVRTTDGREAKLPTVETFREVDPLPERVVERILLGVSTRGYGRSVEAPPPSIPRRGTSQSAASRHLVERTRRKLREDIGRRLDGVDLAALMIDGIEVAKQTLVVALGITTTGEKIPLGFEHGSTENTTLCTLLLNGLIERGLRVTERILCVIDGGKGIRKALGDVFGELAVVHAVPGAQAAQRARSALAVAQGLRDERDERRVQERERQDGAQSPAPAHLVAGGERRRRCGFEPARGTGGVLPT